MSFSMSQASLPALEIGLNALSGVLDKAQAFAAAKKIVEASDVPAPRTHTKSKPQTWRHPPAPVQARHRRHRGDRPGCGGGRVRRPGSGPGV